MWIDQLTLLQLPGPIPWPDLAERYRDIADYFQADPKTERMIIEGLSIEEQRQVVNDVYDFCAAVRSREGDG